MTNINFTNKTSRRFSNVTMGLIILNVGIFLLGYLLKNPMRILALNPQNIVNQKYIWQFFTYMFVHADPSHLLFNMLGLFIFGLPLEKRLGSVDFVVLYLLTGILTGVVGFFFYLNINATLLGASGAIYALLLAFAVFFPETKLLIFMVLPLKAPVAVLFFTLISIGSMIFQFQPGVSHIAHLAGLFFGFFFILIRYKINPLKVFFRK